MCSICLRTPCAPACPNAEQPEPVYTCSKCGYGIFTGEKVFLSPEKGPICEECMESMTVQEILSLLGETMDTVE